VPDKKKGRFASKAALEEEVESGFEPLYEVLQTSA
jgi:hypothetical protein